MTNSDNIQKVAVVIAEAAANLSEAVAKPIIEATQGYRAQIESAGFGSAAAEIMAAAYHEQLIKLVFEQLSRSQAKK